VTFLQEREQDINELADLDSLSEESEADAQARWNKLSALHREYVDEIARSGMGRRQMRRRILVLLDEQWGQERTPPIDRFGRRFALGPRCGSDRRHGLLFMEPKTDRSRRSVTLPRFVINTLRVHKRSQAARRLLLGEAWQNLDLVIEKGDGSAVSPNLVTQAFSRMARKDKFEGCDSTTSVMPTRRSCWSVASIRK
jgi:hypothetical protein